MGGLVIGGATVVGLSTESAYRSVFALAAAFLVLGAAFVSKVQEGQPGRLTTAIS